MPHSPSPDDMQNTDTGPDSTMQTPISELNQVDDPLQWGGMMDTGGITSDLKTPSPAEEKAGPDRTAELQAMAAEIREETEHIVSEPHPETEREDTAVKAHERGEL